MRGGAGCCFPSSLPPWQSSSSAECWADSPAAISTRCSSVQASCCSCLAWRWRQACCSLGLARQVASDGGMPSAELTALHSGAAEFPDWLSHCATASPDRIALEVGPTRWTYFQLDVDATAVATRILALGVTAGDRVATLLRNGAAPVVLVHAVLRAGATLVPLNLRLRDAELAWQLADSGARLLVAEDGTAALAGAAVGAMSQLESASSSRGVDPPVVAFMAADAPGAVTVRSESGDSLDARP